MEYEHHNGHYPQSQTYGEGQIEMTTRRGVNLGSIEDNSLSDISDIHCV